MDLLRHLRFFLAVAEERHFGQAAVALGMTQPPLSQGVQRLERHLGVRLFERDARGVRITDAGTALLPRAEELIAAADRLTAEAGSWSDTPTARIGLVADLGERLGECVAAVAAGSTRVTPVIGGSTELLDQVKDGSLDLAVIRHPGIVDGSTPREVLTVPSRILGASGPAPVRLAEQHLPLVVPLRRHHPAAHDQLVDSLRRAGHSGEVLEQDDPLTRRAMVAAGNVLALTIDRSAVGAELLDQLPLRLRVVLPVTARRRSGVDHLWLAARLEEALRC
jgi:DNA-binding transcriptional LysR family regulator